MLPFAFFIAYGVMSIPAGLLIEKYQEKPVMMLAFAVSFLGSLILALFPNYLNAVFSLFLIGSGMASGNHPACREKRDFFSMVACQV